MSYTLRHAVPQDAGAIIEFLNAHWGNHHPLVNDSAWFSYYYLQDEKLHFCLAEDEQKQIASVCGYIPSSSSQTPDIWVSIWCARKDARGAGFQLMEAMPRLTGAASISCNNIRETTLPFYLFLGYTAQRLPHFYRLGKKEQYRIAVPADKHIPPVFGEATLQLLDEEELSAVFTPMENWRPYKDLAYIRKRYYHFPYQKYQVYGVMDRGHCAALLVTRLAMPEGVPVLRVVDFIGRPDDIALCGKGIQKRMDETGAEYADMYCYGISPDAMRAAGFLERLPEDGTIIPNYLDPLLQQNTEYYFFSSLSAEEGFVMCKADGDQDRPNQDSISKQK